MAASSSRVALRLCRRSPLTQEEAWSVFSRASCPRPRPSATSATAAAGPTSRMRRDVPRRVFSSTSPAFSRDDSGPVELVYDLHSPAHPRADAKTRPILFLHGLFGSKKNNRTISKTLAKDLGRSVYALDLRNHGHSPHAPRHDYLAMAGDVAHFIREHQLTGTTIIGHSMGAKTAMTLALQTPELVDDIVAVDNAPIDAVLSNDFPRYVRGMQEIDSARVTRQADADKILQPYEPSLTVRMFLLGNLHRVAIDGKSVLQFRVPLDTLGRALNSMGDFPFKDPQAVRSEKPALFVRGTKSKYVPDEALPIIGQFFPLFELADIEAGHWLISEKPEEFRQAVLRFLGPKE